MPDYLEISAMARIFMLRKDLQQGTALLLGSRTGTLFRGDRLYETLRPFSAPDFPHQSRNQQFAHCYHLLTRSSQPGFSPADIEKILRNALHTAALTEADISLARLIKQGVFDTILTANMDNTLEQALIYVGMRELRDFEVFSLHAGMNKDTFRPQKQLPCRIIKIFGQFTTRDYTVRRSGYLNQNAEIKNEVQDILTRDCLVIGLDQTWDAELYQAFPPQGNPFWFIDENTPEIDTPLYQLGENRNARYLATGYEPFIRSLESFLQESTLPVEARDLSQHNGIDSSDTTPVAQTMASASGRTLELFLSYVQQDEKLAQKLIEHLAVLKREKLIQTWHSREILAGQVSATEVNRHLDRADIILLLVSASFIASDYIYSIELKRALERHDAGEAQVIPIILRPVNWKSTAFGTLEALPRDGKALTEWRNTDKAARDVVEGIREVANGLRKNAHNQ